MLSNVEWLRHITEDLEYLSQWNERSSEAELRRGSITLRKLLVDGDLGRAWREIGMSRAPQIACYTLDFAAGIPLNRIIFAHAGGIRINGRLMKGSILSFGTHSDELVQTKTSLYLDKFVNSDCLIVEGIPISRRMLIKAVANKLGGGHSQSSAENESNEKIYKAIEDAKRTGVGNWRSIHYELLACAQAISRSTDISYLCQKISQM